MTSYLENWLVATTTKKKKLTPNLKKICHSSLVHSRKCFRTRQLLQVCKLFYHRIFYLTKTSKIFNRISEVSALLLACYELMQKSVMDLFFVVRISKSLWDFVSICRLQSNLPLWAHEKSIWQVTHLIYVLPFVEAWRHFQNCFVANSEHKTCPEPFALEPYFKLKSRGSSNEHLF
jgi:hypothetical protein